MQYNMMSDEDIIRDLAEKFDKVRINKELKDTDVESAGAVSRQIISGFRNGKRGITLKSFISLLRGIGELDSLQAVLKVSDGYSPLKRTTVKHLKRVRDKKKKDSSFKWGDES